MHKTYNIPFLNYKTHCDVYGDLKHNIPLIILHGGPGGCSQRYEPFIDLENDGFAVILYDQLGSGYSKVSGEHYDLWKTETFMDELENLLNFFNIKEYYLMGHSWGGMLALSFITSRKHNGLKKLILYSTLPSTKMWNDEHMKMIENYPEKEREILINDDHSNERLYKKAINRFYVDHVKRKITDKSYIFKRKRFPKLFKQVYNYMWGPSELFGTGTLLNYNVEDKLKLIDIKTLILSGELDESTPYMNKFMNKNIPNSKWVCFEGCHHSSYVERYDLVRKVVVDFLKQ